jgi:dTDP-4-amino-4,6-dideoxygalactose transaminase
MMKTEPQNVPFARPSLDEREVDAARRAILSGWVTQGPEVAAFEREFAEAVGASHACAVSNCTTALHLALLAADVGPGDEVVTVSHSFIASANAIRYCGAIPIFVDIDPATFNIDPARIEAAIGPRTRALLVVHQMGMPCDLARIVPIARSRSIAVIEDAACAAGSELLWDGRWEQIGRPHGDAACFSFHPRKVLTTGDGGMITTSRPEWDRRFRWWRQHGMDMPDTVRHSSRQVIVESYPMLGYNYRLTDIQAAVGREQLKKLPEMVERRRELAARYHQLLGRIPGLTPPFAPDWTRSNWQSYCVRLPAGVDQREIMQYLRDRGIATRRGVMCAHRQPAYALQPWSCTPGLDRCAEGQHCAGLRESVRAEDHAILLPFFSAMTTWEQDLVVSAVAEAVEELTAAQKARV